MEQLIELVIAFVLGWWLGSRVATAMHLLAFRGILKELGISEQQLRELGQKIGVRLSDPETPAAADGLEEIHIKLESHSGIIYAFRKDTDQFLGQGADKELLIARLKQNLTNVRLIVDEGADLLQKNNG